MSVDCQSHTLVVIVENTSGVLTRVAGLFSRRGFNIISLAVAPTDDETLSRITVVVDAESASLEQIKQQLFKLINVVKITELTDQDSVERELILVSINASKKDMAKIEDINQKYGSKIVSQSEEAVILAMEGTQAMVDKLENSLKEYGILELQRTGKISLSSV